MNDKPTVENVFRRLLKGGALRRLPKSHADLQIVIGLAASALDPQRTYTEAEVNEWLKEWMAGFTRPSALDHVTIRRYLVDYRFLLRDPAGASYRTNQTMINTVIEPAARSVQPLVLFEEIQQDQAQRRRVNPPVARSGRKS